MLDCYTLSLLSLSLTLSIIIIIICIINAILEEKEKAKWWESGFTNKTVWTCSYACHMQKISVFFRIYNSVCKFDKNKNENLV